MQWNQLIVRLKNSNEAAKYRDTLLIEQTNRDPITGSMITDPCLDHQHFGEQHCRQVLQRESNSFEGRVYNSYTRYIKHLTDDPLPVVLRRLADYLERDYSDRPIHHTALAVDVGKFKRLPADVQKQIITTYGLVPGTNVKAREKQARALIISGTLKIIEWQ